MQKLFANNRVRKDYILKDLVGRSRGEYMEIRCHYLHDEQSAQLNCASCGRNLKDLFQEDLIY